jgi:hypothetical protein
MKLAALQVTCRHKYRRPASNPVRPLQRQARSQHGQRGRCPAARCTELVRVACRTHASGNELQLHARYGQNDCVIALGRKNSLFAGSDAGGERAAAFYSLIGTAKLCGLDPEAYLRYVFEHIAEHPINKINELLPWCLASKANTALAA